MSHHGSEDPSSYYRTGYRSNAKFSTPGKSRSNCDCTDDICTNSRGWRYNRDYTAYYRSKPVVTSALRCLVGKFEAMDALSLPIQDFTLQPAPLNSARNSPRRRGRTRDSSQRRLSPILSPNSTSLSKDDDIFVDEYTGNNTWADTPSSTKSTILGSPKKQFQSQQLRTPQRPFKVVRTPSKSGNRITPSRSISKNRNATRGEIPTYVQPKKSPNKKIGNSIKDRVRFFDGTPDEKASSSPSKTSSFKTDPPKSAPNHESRRYNDEPYPTSYATGAETPILKAPVGVPGIFSGTSELSREKSTFASPAEPQSPTLKKQRKVFGEAVQNPFLNSQGSSEKTRSSLTISPHTSPMKQKPFYKLDSENKADTGPRGRSLARYQVNTTPTRNSELPKIPRPRGRTIPGRKDAKTGIQKDIDSRRNQISEKIQAIYQAKSSERKALNPEKIFLQENHAVSPLSRNDGRDDEVRRPQRIKDTSSFRSKSKVADMRMRFDGGTSFAGTVLPGSASKDVERRAVAPVKKEGGALVVPVPPPLPPPPPPPPPPPISPSCIYRKKNMSPEHPMPVTMPIPIPIQHNPSPKSPTPRTQTPSKALLQRVSTLPLQKLEKIVAPRRQQMPEKESPQRVEISPTPSQRVEKPALQTWPRARVERPKRVGNGLIADKLRLFEEIGRRNGGVVGSARKEGEKEMKEKEVDGSKNVGSGKVARTLVDGRKEFFEMSPGRGGDGDGNGRVSNPVFPNAIIAKESWNGRGKEEERGEKLKTGGGGFEAEKSEVSPMMKEKEKQKEKGKARDRNGSKGPRLGSRKHVVGRWNEISPSKTAGMWTCGVVMGEMMSVGDRDEGLAGEALAHLPVKRGLRDGRMHMGRDGSHSIDWNEVEREIEREGGLDLGELELEVLVGKGRGRGEMGFGLGFAVMSEERGESVKRDGDVNMVIKEAECSLKEPKPLRAVEMKRMVEICRDRDRERIGSRMEERERSRGRKLERRK